MDDLSAKKSKCWTCTYGICVQEMGHEHVFQPKGLPAFGNEFEGSSEPGEMEEKIVSVSAPKTVCFWKPVGVEMAPPIVMAFVGDCNRYNPK